MHTIEGGLDVSSLYIVYSDEPLGVVSCHGDCFVPDPFTFAILSFSSRNKSVT
jgi:hypothetical protein